MQLQTIHLTKTYPGGVQAVQPVNVSFGSGIVGLLGPNGAGKTTLMRMLATLTEPTDGTALVDGLDIRYQKADVRRILGYLPQEFGLYPSLSVWECLDYLGILAGLSRARDRKERMERTLDRVNLTELRHRKVGALSGGMKRRLGIAQAILHEPRLLIFDEPTAGLDPEERIRIRNLLAELAGDRLILLSTHIVADIASSARVLAVMRRGEIIFTGETQELLERVRGRCWQCVVPEGELQALSTRVTVIEVQREATGMLVRLVADPDAAAGMSPREPSLEDAYVWTMGPDAAAAVARDRNGDP